MKFSLKIETYDKRLGFDIAGDSDSPSAGAVVEVPGGAEVEYKSTYVYKGFGIPEILEFIVDTSIEIDIGLFSAWLYDKVKDKPVEKIVIQRKEVTEITEGNIRKTLEEEIKIND